MFSNLYTVSQSGAGDLENFFAHENHVFPVSLSEYGQLRGGTKSDFLDCLESIDKPTYIKQKTDAYHIWTSISSNELPRVKFTNIWQLLWSTACQQN